MTNNQTQVKQLILRCQKNPRFFIENFCKVKHPKAGVLQFKLFKYQDKSLHAFLKHRFNVYRKCRQSGISTLAGAFALWYAMFFSHKTILIVSKRDDDAKGFLDKNIKFVYENLPPLFKEIFGNPPPIFNEHNIVFKNGSSIKSLTSNKETLRSNSATLVIIDEAAFMADMDAMWAGGWSCLNQNTKIISDNIICEIGSLGDLNGPKWQNINVHVQSDFEIQKSDQFYINGECDTNIITTSLGFKLECTDNHRLKDSNYEWIYSKDIRVGDKLALKCGSNFTKEFDTLLSDGLPNFPSEFIVAKNSDTVNPVCYRCSEVISINYRGYKRNLTRNENNFICQACMTTNNFSPNFIKPNILDEKLAEIVGYYIGDGSLCLERPKRLRLCYDPQDQDIYERFQSYFASLNLITHKEWANGAEECRVDNAKFVEWFVHNRFNTKTYAFDAQVPDIILKSSCKIRKAFLRGLFEADGWHYLFLERSRPKTLRHHLGFSSVSEKLIDQVQFMLLDLGIISKKKQSYGGYENSGISWRLELFNLDEIIKFSSGIGFISKRKDIETYKFRDQEPTKYKISDDGIFYDEVVNVSRGHSMTVDISVPANNTYVANGFISHNTLQHGGNVIVISTANGQGNWYHSTWEDARSKKNDFNPIVVNWWDMDWKLTYIDELTGNQIALEPTKGLRKCTTKEDIDKWGPYYSPWLEEQYRGLQREGKAHKFRQEILAEFIGSGSTVLSREALLYVESTISDEYQTVKHAHYIHPVTGQELELDFQDELWIWAKPVKPTPPTLENGRIVKLGNPGHSYTIGIDISSGEADDYSAIEIFDVTTLEQVAELNIKVEPNILLLMADYLGRWYNGAFIVPERTGLGIPFCQDLYGILGYTNIFRMNSPSTPNKKTKKIGFPTSHTYKPILEKQLLDHIQMDGVTIYSSRLCQQFQVLVHLGANRFGNIKGTGNHDDLPMATAMALLGIREAVQADTSSMIPTKQQDIDTDSMMMSNSVGMESLMIQGGMGCLMPLVVTCEDLNIVSKETEVMKFVTKLGAIPFNSSFDINRMGQRRPF